MKKYFLQIT